MHHPRLHNSFHTLHVHDTWNFSTPNVIGYLGTVNTPEDVERVDEQLATRTSVSEVLPFSRYWTLKAYSASMIKPSGDDDWNVNWTREWCHCARNSKYFNTPWRWETTEWAVYRARDLNHDTGLVSEQGLDEDDVFKYILHATESPGRLVAYLNHTDGYNVTWRGWFDLISDDTEIYITVLYEDRIVAWFKTDLPDDFEAGEDPNSDSSSTYVSLQLQSRKNYNWRVYNWRVYGGSPEEVFVVEPCAADSYKGSFGPDDEISDAGSYPSCRFIHKTYVGYDVSEYMFLPRCCWDSSDDCWDEVDDNGDIKFQCLCTEIGPVGLPYLIDQETGEWFTLGWKYEDSYVADTVIVEAATYDWDMWDTVWNDWDDDDFKALLLEVPFSAQLFGCDDKNSFETTVT